MREALDEEGVGLLLGVFVNDSVSWSIRGVRGFYWFPHREPIHLPEESLVI
jgi:hypothetical protein